MAELDDVDDAVVSGAVDGVAVVAVPTAAADAAGDTEHDKQGA